MMAHELRDGNQDNSTQQIKIELSMKSHTEQNRILKADARKLADRLPKNSIDLIVTSPPYWQCRDYQHRYQLGQEKTPEAYIKALVDAIDSWKPLLRPHASVIINIGDVFRNGNLIGIPAMFELAVREHKWHIANRIVWAKDRGVPEPKPRRLATRYEFVFHLVLQRKFYFDLYGLEEHLQQTANPGDVWNITQSPSSSAHLAPFPIELAKRAILLACPEHICPKCGTPFTRRLKPTMNLDLSRPQAKRALKIYKDSKLTKEHIAAIRAVGISDAGKALKTQNGANKNAAHILTLANEAKEVLGGYFREFTFAPKRQSGWNRCKCNVDPIAGTVLDPFMGSGTTLRAARELHRNGVGVDIQPPKAI